MPTSIRIIAFAVAVAVAGGIGWAAGDTVGPEPPSISGEQHEHTGSTP